MSAVPELSGRQPGAVHSALAVLEEVARSGAGISAQQISDRLGLPRATAYRILNLLVQDEYLVRMPDLRGFALGRKVAELADVAHAQDAAATARTVVAELRGRIRGGVHLAVYTEGRVVPVDVDPDFPLSDPKRISADLSVFALGRLLLAEQGLWNFQFTVAGVGPAPAQCVEVDDAPFRADGKPEGQGLGTGDGRAGVRASRPIPCSGGLDRSMFVDDQQQPARRVEDVCKRLDNALAEWRRLGASGADRFGEAA